MTTWEAARATAGGLPARLRGGGWRNVPREILVVVTGVVIYFGVRGLTASDAGTAVAHGQDLMDLERWLGIAWEDELQQLVIGSHTAVTVLNWIYIWGHWPVIAIVLVSLAVTRPEIYYRTRNAMIASGLIGTAIFVSYPVAPPRLMDAGLVDTVTQRSNSYRVLQPPAFVNQYAALPSLHVGWDLLMGIAVWTAATGVTLRVIGALMPLAMVTAVVLTANHYLLDVVAGAAVALTGLAAAVAYERFQARRTRPPQVIQLPEPRRPDEPCSVPARATDPRRRVPAQSDATNRTCVG